MVKDLQEEERSHPGAVIKRLRKEKHMTQAELCGEEISRNLLSQIESGKVRPSLKTMEYLAKRLSVPLSLFFLTERQRQILRISELMPSIERAWQEQDYDACLALCLTTGSREDMIGYRMAGCLYRLGYRQYAEGRLDKAVDSFQRVIEMGEVYPEAARAAGEMLSRIELVTEADPIPTLMYGDPLENGEDRMLVTLALNCIENGTVQGVAKALRAWSGGDGNGKSMALALLYAAEGSDSDCRAAQIAVRERELTPSEALYHYRACEECCAKMYDYETAYKMAKKRRALFERLRGSLRAEKE